MANKAKLYLLIFLIIGCSAMFFSCKNHYVEVDEVIYYKYFSLDSDSIVLFSSNSKISILKDNLYFTNNTVYIGVPLFEDEIDKEDKIVSIRKGIVLIDPLLKYNLSIDTLTYHFIVKELIASDKNNVIAFPRGIYKLPFIQVLELNPSKTVLCDSNGTYLKDDSLVYCIPTNTYLEVSSKDFDVFLKDNVVFGKYKNVVYYLDTPEDTLHEK
ncbi:MAG: hypothetical protein PHI32_09095 [Dysgonamonadaceae bacterium]|nr:hypothetical protein [Dysgonamonadaceae bacterium]